MNPCFECAPSPLDRVEWNSISCSERPTYEPWNLGPEHPWSNTPPCHAVKVNSFPQPIWLFLENDPLLVGGGGSILQKKNCQCLP